MSDKTREFPASYAWQVGTKLLGKLEPVIARGEIVGSLRRNKPHVHDLDLLIVPRSQSDLFASGQPDLAAFEQQLEQIISESQGIIRLLQGKDKKKMLTVTHPRRPELDGLQVDVFITSLELWAVQLLIWTGSKEHNVKLTSFARSKGMSLAVSKGLVELESGQVITTPSEADIFTALGLPYIEPKKREG